MNSKNNFPEPESKIQTTSGDNKEGIRNLMFHEMKKFLNKPIKLAYKDFKTIENFKKRQKYNYRSKWKVQ